MGEPLLLDTAPLRDQRTMVNVHAPQWTHRTPAEVEAAWKEWADEYGLIVRRRRGDYSTDLHESRKVVHAFVTGGKWLALCPACNGGVAAWPYHERGCCLDCGTVYRIQYPPQPQIDEAVRLLAERPENQRHWHAHEGETVEKLAEENKLLNRQSILTGAVGLDTVLDVLGVDAIQKLKDAGVM